MSVARTYPALVALGLALCAILPGLGGCSSYSAPQLSVADVKIKEETPAGLVLEFTLDATNKNTIELPLRDVRYELKLGGREVFSGVRSPEAALRRLGTQRIVIPAVIPLGPGSPRPVGLVAYELSGTLGYLTPGQFAQVLFDIKVSRPKVRFGERGTMDFGATGATIEPGVQSSVQPETAPGGSQ